VALPGTVFSVPEKRLPTALFMPQAVDSFLIVSSLICLAIGLLHLSGTRQLIWELS
jgi:hypothetical protein